MHLANNKRRGTLYVVITIIWTWGVLAVPIVCGFDFSNIVTMIAYILAGASPSVIGLSFVLLSGSRAYIFSFLKRMVTIGSTSLIGLLITFTLIPAITLTSAAINYLFTSTYPDFSILSTYSKDLTGLMLFAAFTFIFGPLAEEIGWRGYLLDCWKDKGVFIYGAGIGLLWTLWHLPMFFIVGTYQNSLLLQGAMPVIYFALSTTALGVIIGHITKVTNSVLLAILFHFTINFTGEMIPLTITGEMINTIILIVIAFGIMCRDLSKRSRCNETGKREQIKM